MAWSSAGLQLTDATSGVLNLNFAKNINTILMAEKGNKVISGYVATANASSNLTTSQVDVDVTAGSALINGNVRTNSSALSISLDSIYNSLGTGEAVYVYLYLTDAATPVLTAVAGTAGTGTIYPPEVPENVVTIALIYLIESTTILTDTYIRDYRIFTPNSNLYADNKKLYFGSSGDMDTYHSGSHGFIENRVGQIVMESTNGGIYLDVNNFVRIRNVSNGGVYLFDFDTSAKTLAIGDSSNIVTTSLYGNLYFKNTGYGVQWYDTSLNATVRLRSSGTLGDNIYLESFSQDRNFIIGSSTYKFNILSYGPYYNRVDNSGFLTGANDDLWLYHNGTDSYIYNSTGNLILNSISGDIVAANDFRFSDVASRIAMGTTIQSRMGLNQYQTFTDTNALIYGHLVQATLTGAANNLGFASYFSSLTLNNASQTLTDNKGFWVKNPTVTAGSITNNYGIYIENQTAGTNNYSIYSAGGINTFLGKVYNRTDNSGIFSGVSDDIGFYHDGSHSWLKNITGALILRNSSSDGSIQLRANDSIQFYDSSTVKLFDFNTPSKNFTVGDGSNSITSKYYGTLQLTGIAQFDSYVGINGGIGDSTYNLDVTGTIRETGIIYSDVGIISGSGLIPATDGVGSLGSSTKAWNELYAKVTITANAANAYVSSSTGQFLRSTSSRRYKKNISDIEIPTDYIFNLRPVSFDSITEKGRFFGLVAEEVYDVIPDLVDLNKDGQPESVKYSQLAVLLLPELKKLRDRVEYLESIVNI